MKIAFATSGDTLDSPMDPRFGRAVNFLIYDEERKDVTVLSNANAAAAQGAGLKAAETIAQAGAKVLITRDCGPKALDALKRASITIYHAQAAASIKAALEAYQAGKLPEIA